MENAMNHIHRLQNDIADLNDQIMRRAERIAEFRAHLALPKFAAVQSDGSRGGWISTADVHRWLQYIEDIAQNRL
jgi:hypothetical protein